jgi:tetratricopeptide (TPR) repeat protein
METVARDQRILYKSATYRRGIAQFETNLRAALGKFERAKVPVFIGTVASNVRDIAPFAALSGADTSGSAAADYKSGRRALDAANLRAADSLFTLARDEDFVRFRAPSDFNVVIHRVARESGAHVVPVEDDIRGASQFHIPGGDLFFEHVHLRSKGYAIIGRSYVVAMQKAKAIGGDANLIGTAERYDSTLALTALDERIAQHSINTVSTRWPFLPAKQSQDYRASYRPVDMVDSLALAVSRGALRWDKAKLTLAAKYESSGKPDLALAEYNGLVRHEPLFEGGYEGAGRTLLALGKRDSAERVLQRAYALQPTGGTALALGILALERKDLRSATRLLEESVRLQPANPEAFYRLSFAYALARDIDRSRAAAVHAYQLRPGFPGLAGWLSTLGMPPPGR